MKNIIEKLKEGGTVALHDWQSSGVGNADANADANAFAQNTNVCFVATKLVEALEILGDKLDAQTFLLRQIADAQTKPETASG